MYSVSPPGRRRDWESPSAIAFIRHLFVNFEDSQRNSKSILAERVIFFAGKAAADIFDIIVPHYASQNKLQTAMLQIVADNGGLPMVEALLLRLEESKLKDMMNLGSFPIFIFFANRNSIYRARVLALLGPWLVDFRRQRRNLKDLSELMRFVIELDVLSEEILDGLFLWMWRSQVFNAPVDH